MKSTAVKSSRTARAQFSNAGPGRIVKLGRVGIIKAPSILVPQFANAQDLVLGADPGGGYRGGQVFFANDSRFLETYFSEPLTNYAVGWRDPNNIEETVNFIAPPVPVGRRFEWKAAANAEEFLSEVNDDARAIGADFKQVKYTGTDVTDKTINRGLTLIVDLDNVTGTNWQNQKTAKLLRRLWRNRLRRAISALDAASVSVPYNWAPAPANPGVVPVNPDQDVKTELKAATDISGIRPNRVLYGDSAALYRDGAYGSQNTPAGYAGYLNGAWENSVAQALRVDKVMVSKERYQSTGTAKSEIVGASVYAFFAEDGVDTEDPTNIKCFLSTFDAEQGGGLVRVYIQQLSAKLVAITVEVYEKIVVTYAGGIRKLAVTGS